LVGRSTAAWGMRLRSYLLFSAGVCLTTLGLGITVSVLAVVYAERPPRLEAAAEPGAMHFAANDLFRLTSEIGGEAGGRPPATRLDPGYEPVVRGRLHDVNITFYDCLNDGFCGVMYNGKRVYEGAAACSWNMPLGTTFRIQGDPTARIYSCDDRGLLSNTWVDVFFYDPADGWLWQATVGRYGTIEILEVPAAPSE
jgi:hypothetical protein